MNTEMRTRLVMLLVLSYVVGCGGGTQTPVSTNIEDNPFAADDDVTVQSTEKKKTGRKRREVTRVASQKKPSKSSSSKQPQRRRAQANLNNVHALIGERPLPNQDQPSDEVPLQEQHPLAGLLGQPAPDLEVVLLEGGTVQLNRPRSSQIMVLVFWTTYPKKFENELPLLQKVMAGYGDKDVELLAVNDGENGRKVRTFLAKHKLTLPVGLDQDQLVADAFGIQKMPCVVIVDQQNVVQSIHEGYIKTLDLDVKQDLEALLEGKDITKQSRQRLNSKIPRRH